MKALRIGLIGLDTSHVESFAELINHPDHPHHVAGGRIVAGYPGGSPDFPLSIGRVGRYTQLLRDSYGVAVLDSPRAVAETVDAVLLTSADGRIHLRQFAEIVSAGKPVFLDKPFATSADEAREIVGVARRHRARLFSSSSLRFASGLQDALADSAPGPLVGADFSGPLKLEPTQPGYFWYGIHLAEMLYAALGRGCLRVRVVSTPDHELAVGTWADGRLGSLRGRRAGSGGFAGVLHWAGASRWIDSAAGRPAEAGLTEAIMRFFHGGPAPVELDETLELIRFLEAANESRGSGGREIAL